MSRILSDIHQLYVDAKQGPEVNGFILERFKQQMIKFMDFTVLKLPIIVETNPNLGNMICHSEAFQNKCQFLTFVDAVSLGRRTIDDADIIDSKQIEIIKRNILENFAQKATVSGDDVLRDFDFEKDREIFEHVATDYSLRIDVYRGFKGRSLSLLNREAYVFPLLYKSYKSKNYRTSSISTVKIVYYEDLDQFETLDYESWPLMIDLTEDEFNEFLFRYFFINRETYDLRDLEILKYAIKDAEEVYGPTSTEMLMNMFGRFMDDFYETVDRIMNNKNLDARLDDIEESMLKMGDETLRYVGNYKYNWTLVRENARFPSSTSQLRTNAERAFSKFESDLKLSRNGNRKRRLYIDDIEDFEDLGEGRREKEQKQEKEREREQKQEKEKDETRGNMYVPKSQKKQEQYKKITLLELLGGSMEDTVRELELPDGRKSYTLEKNDGEKEGGKDTGKRGGPRAMTLRALMNRDYEDEKKDKEFASQTLGGAKWCSSKGEKFKVKLKFMDSVGKDLFELPDYLDIMTRTDTVSSLVDKALNILYNNAHYKGSSVTQGDVRLKMMNDADDEDEYNYKDHKYLKICNLAKKYSTVRVIIPKTKVNYYRRSPITGSVGGSAGGGGGSF